MRYTNNLFIASLILISTCAAAVNKTNQDNFLSLVKCVSDGNNSCLKEIPVDSWALNFEQSIMLRNALAHALIKSPLPAIDALNRIDKEAMRTGHSFNKDNYGADVVCGYMIDSNLYDRASFFKYYSIAKSKLKEAGDKGKFCLKLMDLSVEETIYEEKAGKMIWGKEKYFF